MILEQLSKYKIHAIVVIFLIVIFFYFRKERLSARKKRGTESRKATIRKKNGKSKKQERKPKEPEKKGFLSRMFGTEKQQEDEDDQAEELYNLVHDDMVDMTMEEFEDIASEYGENDLFIELKQLYNDCEKKNKNVDDITVEDYAVILEKLKDD